MGKNHNSTSDLKQKIKDILRQTNAKFSETDFDKNWRDFYVDERCPIVHRSGSKLVCSNIFRIRQDIKQSSMMYKVGLVLSHKPIQKMKKPILLKRSSRINSTAYVK
ncbi:MAG TPA: hypothetical protein VHF65_04400 [Nitrososphaera sp.]|nr:hypothetical protein [Nitrososphaera sp.]